MYVSTANVWKLTTIYNFFLLFMFLWDGLAERSYASTHVSHFMWFSVETYTNHVTSSSHLELKTCFLDPGTS